MKMEDIFYDFGNGMNWNKNILPTDLKPDYLYQDLYLVLSTITFKIVTEI